MKTVQGTSQDEARQVSQEQTNVGGACHSEDWYWQDTYWQDNSLVSFLVFNSENAYDMQVKTHPF